MQNDLATGHKPNILRYKSSTAELGYNVTKGLRVVISEYCYNSGV